MKGGFNRSVRLRRQRYRLWKANPRCHWCGCITVIVRKLDAKLPMNMATIDHLYSRLHPLRHAPNDGKEFRHVLACWKCNNDRGIAELVEFGERQRVRSGAQPWTLSELQIRQCQIMDQIAQRDQQLLSGDGDRNFIVAKRESLGRSLRYVEYRIDALKKAAEPAECTTKG